jgi:hypothetical protein
LKKIQKIWGFFEEFGFRVVFEKNGNNGANGRPEVGGFWILGRRGAEEMGFGCTAGGKEMGKREKKLT